MIQIHLTEEDYWQMNKFAMIKLYGKGMLIAVCLKKLARESKGILGDQKLEITEQEIRWSNDMIAGTTKWKGLESFSETKQYFYIFINKASAHVIPKRSFETEDEAAHFAKQVKAYMKAA